MTLNERLFAAGLLPAFDEALAIRDRAALTEMLTAVDTDRLWQTCYLARVTHVGSAVTASLATTLTRYMSV